ncbi:Endonuclease/exonuclease/phosphatase [Blyttiomyces helicus]|uniref:Endonuclease/exonuclease/phosphatase n=1 Tax=Blyttiomyces helicus TaxID=388810 RepID=A0A4P9WP20_9FUNG|nr:Endonuclease/exonuclease/phosphatase [Blyttiomyces helicus]|eukprot:RKO94045.1 Endonuclease/exonuclease/phosphatase [Blyttiomyces helicus]
MRGDHYEPSRKRASYWDPERAGKRGSAWEPEDEPQGEERGSTSRLARGSRWTHHGGHMRGGRGGPAGIGRTGEDTFRRGESSTWRGRGPGNEAPRQAQFQPVHEPWGRGGGPRDNRVRCDDNPRGDGGAGGWGRGGRGVRESGGTRSGGWGRGRDGGERDRGGDWPVGMPANGRGGNSVNSTPSYSPLHRDWEFFKTSTSTTGPTFKVMSYNALAPSLANAEARRGRARLPHEGTADLGGDQGFVPIFAFVNNSERFNHKTRTPIPRFAANIHGTQTNIPEARDADIVCLQEVDAKDFKSLFEPALKKCGFAGAFAQCTGDKIDGSAIFVRRERFTILDIDKVQYHPHRDNAGIILMIETVDSEFRLCVASTHILFAPNAGLVKAAQICVLTDRIREMVERHKDFAKREIPIILCGDFNLRPFSHLYDFLLTGETRTDTIEPRYMSGQNALRHNSYRRQGPPRPAPPPPADPKSDDSPATDPDTSDSNTSETDASESDSETFDPTSLALPLQASATSPHILRHPLALTCIYAPHQHTSTGEPHISTWHDMTKEMVDYMFHGRVRGTRTRLHVTRYLKTPVAPGLEKMPSPRQPSDHLALVAEFVIEDEAAWVDPFFLQTYVGFIVGRCWGEFAVVAWTRPLLHHLPLRVTARGCKNVRRKIQRAEIYTFASDEVLWEDKRGKGGEDYASSKGGWK